MRKKDKKLQNPLFEKNLKGKIIFIRHGETNYNVDLKKKGFKIKGDIKYIDGHLNVTGERQAVNCSTNFFNLNIENVYVSPLFRAIQTAYFIFRYHPNRKNIIFHVHPLLTEIVSSMNNFIWNIEATKKMYNMNSEIKVDWSIFDNEFKTPEEQNFFYFKYINLLPEPKYGEFKRKIKDSYRTDKGNSCLVELGKVIVDSKMKRLESLDHLFDRAVSFKEYLKEKYKNSMNEPSKKIVIISHSCFGQMFTSRECYNKRPIKEYPSDCCEMKNCEAISVFI